MKFKSQSPKIMSVNDIKTNEENPRYIKDEKFDKLVKSLQDFPKMFEYKPIIVNEDNMVLCGNMRLRAAMKLDYKEIPVLVAVGLSKEEQDELIIKDNLGYGEWDWDMLADKWDYEKLDEWGMDVPGFGMNSDFIESDEYNYQNKVTIEFKDFESATAYYENALKENLKARLS